MRKIKIYIFHIIFLNKKIEIFLDQSRKIKKNKLNKKFNSANLKMSFSARLLYNVEKRDVDGNFIESLGIANSKQEGINIVNKNKEIDEIAGQQFNYFVEEFYTYW
jgi:hypothetical protein